MDSPCIKQTVCKVLKIFQHGKYLVAYVLNAKNCSRYLNTNVYAKVVTFYPCYGNNPYKFAQIDTMIPTQILVMHRLNTVKKWVCSGYNPITHCRQIQGTMRKGEVLQFLHEEIIY